MATFIFPGESVENANKREQWVKQNPGRGTLQPFALWQASLPDGDPRKALTPDPNHYVLTRTRGPRAVTLMDGANKTATISGSHDWFASLFELKEGVLLNVLNNAPAGSG